MVDYNNLPSKKSSPKEKPEIQKVVTGEVITRKKPLGNRFKDVFFGSDLKPVGQYIAADVLYPAMRNLVVDIASKGVERLIYGDAGRYKPSGRPGYQPRNSFGSMSFTNYNSMSNHQINTGYRAPRSRPGSFEEIIVSSRRDAQMVLETMQDIIDGFNVVSVADLKELIGLKLEHVDNNWGWVYIQDAKINQIREGYMIVLPSPDSI